MTGYGVEKENALIRKQEMFFFGIEIWEELHSLAAGDILVESGACKGTPHKERTERDVALLDVRL